MTMIGMVFASAVCEILIALAASPGRYAAIYSAG